MADLRHQTLDFRWGRALRPLRSKVYGLKSFSICVICGFLCFLCSMANGGQALPDDVQAKAFFELVNLEYPGLEDVKAAVESEDYARAKDLLVRYYKTRTHPGWYWDKPPKHGLFSGHDDTSAADVLARKFTILLKTAQLERKIDWSASPFRDREWPWLLNRHQFFQALGREYARTGDEKYAAAFNEIITDWIVSNPVPAERSRRTSSWRTIEAGIRTFSSWQVAWQVFKDSPSFTTDARILMLKSFAEHADYLAKYPAGGNWLLMECNGLLHIGALFPEFKDAPKWRQTAIDRLMSQMATQVYPDGAQFELSSSYHNVSLWSFLHPALLSRIADRVTFPTEYFDGLRRMMAYNAGIIRPDGKAPMLNDSDLGDQMERISDPMRQLGAERMPEVRALLDMPRAKKSVFFPYAGIFCMRTGDEPDDLYLMMDAGPFGAGHQHEDKLDVEVYAYGRPLIVDPGRYSYAVGAPFRVAGAHNLILVDGLGQHRRKTDRGKWIVKEPAPGNRWVPGDGFDYAEGTYDDGFGPENDRSVMHVRKIFFIKPEYWIVADVLFGEGEHKFEQLWHFMPGQVEAGPGLAKTSSPDAANLAVVRSDGADVRVVEGEERPVLGYYSPWYNEREPAPTAVFTRTSEVPTVFETVLYPCPAGETVVPEVNPLRCLVDGKRPRPGQVSAISIRLPEREDVFIICHDRELVDKPKRFLDFEFTGEAVWIRTDRKGAVKKVLTLEGRELLRRGRPVAFGENAMPGP